jgi:two-component system chemotaxis response regulator CheY
VSGLDILARLRELDPQAKVIIGTADIQEFTRRAAAELGAAGFINKPFTSEDVQETVRRAVGQNAGGAG